ncbi:MAG: sel1 repeat family protein [Methylococcaceae bacterium]|nr:sel1 repeat family protein [Methylococcaceae bacterium]
MENPIIPGHQVKNGPMISIRKTPVFFTVIFILALSSACGGANQPDLDCSLIDIEQLESAAEQGLPEAQNELAQHFEKGECVSRDFDEAARWYQLAAEQGNVNAQKVLGFMYAGGMGVARDNALSLKWFRSAAEAGHPEAQLGLATAYFRGIGVEKDQQIAAEWFRKSAEQNFARSQYNLGNLYRNGLGVPQDLAEAYKWYGLSARNGYPKADKAMAELEQQLTPDLVNRARQSIAEWQPRTRAAEPGL